MKLRHFLLWGLLFPFRILPVGRMVHRLYKAKALAAQGNHAEALQEYVWIQEHAREYSWAFEGARLSYGLGYWARLGGEYPPARKALKEMRNKKMSVLFSGAADPGLFEEVAALNNALSENEVSAILFEKLEETEPGKYQACIWQIGEELVFRGRFDLIRKYMGDPVKAYRRAKRGLQAGKVLAAVTLNIADTRGACRNIFVKEVSCLLKVLYHTGDRALAKKIQAQALEVQDCPPIRNALNQ